MNSDPDILGRRIQKLRIERGLSQKDLARACGFQAHQTVSMIEKGRRSLSAWELKGLCSALRCDMEALLSESPDYDTAPAILWSAPTGRRANVRSRRKRLDALFARKLADYARVERACGLEASQWLDEFDWDRKNPSAWQAEKLARSFSDALGLGSRPAFTLARLLESEFHIKIWYEDIGAVGRAASCRGPGGYGVLLNAFEAPWRRNYNLARELFHLVTWPAPEPAPAGSERLAHVFASSLLLPHKEFDRLLARRKAGAKLTFEDLFQLARDFGVSAESVLWRLEELRRLRAGDAARLLSDSHLPAIDRQTVGASWLRAPRLPERFVRLCFFAHRRRGVPRAALPALLECAAEEVHSVFLAYGFDDREEYSTPVRSA